MTDDLKVTHQWGAVYSQVMRDPDLSGQARLLYAYLATYAGQGGAWPALRTMCQQLCASERSVRRWREELLEAGYLMVTQRSHPSGASTTNIHSLWSPGWGTGTSATLPQSPRSGGVAPMPGGGGTHATPEGGTHATPRSEEPRTDARARRATAPTWTPDGVCPGCHCVHDPADPLTHPAQGRAPAAVTTAAIADIRATLAKGKQQQQRQASG